MATETKETTPVKSESKFSFGAVPTIDTAEETVQAYLQGKISEDELRTGLAGYGITQVANVGIERPDANFPNKIPDDLLQAAAKPASLEDRLKMVEKKAKEREESTKEVEKAEKASV